MSVLECVRVFVERKGGGGKVHVRGRGAGEERVGGREGGGGRGQGAERAEGEEERGEDLPVPTVGGTNPKTGWSWRGKL